MLISWPSRRQQLPRARRLSSGATGSLHLSWPKRVLATSLAWLFSWPPGSQSASLQFDSKRVLVRLLPPVADQWSFGQVNVFSIVTEIKTISCSGWYVSEPCHSVPVSFALVIPVSFAAEQVRRKICWQAGFNLNFGLRLSLFGIFVEFYVCKERSFDITVVSTRHKKWPRLLRPHTSL